MNRHPEEEEIMMLIDPHDIPKAVARTICRRRIDRLVEGMIISQDHLKDHRTLKTMKSEGDPEEATALLLDLGLLTKQ